MSEPDDPLDPEAWFGVPGVCGSCIAWRPTEPGSDDTIAIGLCRLRPELRRVPGNLAKCPKYAERGGFTYRPSSAPTGARRRRAAPAVVKKRNEAGELVEVSPTPKPRATRGPSARPPRGEGGAAVSVSALVEAPTFRPWPAPESPPPASVDLGELSLPLVEAALVELMREAIPGRPREMHAKYRRGGRVRVEDAEGKGRTVPAHQFFGWIEGLARALDALEEAIDTHPSLDAEAIELSDQVRRMRGSFTTFNLLLADRADYFSGKS